MKPVAYFYVSTDTRFMMLEITIQGVFYGMGRTMPPAVISVTCNYLRIPMALLFVSWGWGLPGIWWSISITSTMKGLLSDLVYTYQEESFKLSSCLMNNFCIKSLIY